MLTPIGPNCKLYSVRPDISLSYNGKNVTLQCNGFTVKVNHTPEYLAYCIKVRNLLSHNVAYIFEPVP